MTKKIFPFLVLIFILLPLIVPLMRPGFFVTDDGTWMIIRLAAFHQSLRMGEFPVRFIFGLNHGYGYPVSNFLYPLPFYLGEIVHLAIPSFVNSIKVLFAASFIFSSFGMFVWLKSKFGNTSAVVSAVFYSFASYRIFDVYTRGSLGEAVSFVFIPLIFFYLDKIFTSRKFVNIILGAISYSALIMSHNVVALVFTPVIFLYILINSIKSENRNGTLKACFLFLTLSFGFSFWFWFPALYDYPFTIASQIMVSDYQKYFINHTNLFPLTGLIIPILLISLITNFRQKRKNITVYFWLTISTVSLFLAAPLSSMVWSVFPLARYIQFPWRFLSLTVFSAAVLLGILTGKIKNYFVISFLTLIVVTVGLFALKIQPEVKPESFYTTNDDTTTVKNEYLSKWLKKPIENLNTRPIEIISGQAQVKDNTVTVNSPSVIRVNKMYFPGLILKINGLDWPITYKASGLVETVLPKGKFIIGTTYKETSYHLVSDIVSIVFFLFAAVLLIGEKKKWTI